MSERVFSNKHIWVLQSGDIAMIGITGYAQEKLGSIMFVNLPDVGEVLEIGKRFGDIESIKTVSDLFSPIEGEVIEVNDELVDEPEGINESPYDSWLLKAKVIQLSNELMNEETYESQKEGF